MPWAPTWQPPSMSKNGWSTWKPRRRPAQYRPTRRSRKGPIKLNAGGRQVGDPSGRTMFDPSSSSMRNTAMSVSTSSPDARGQLDQAVGRRLARPPAVEEARQPERAPGHQREPVDHGAELHDLEAGVLGQ